MSWLPFPAFPLLFFFFFFFFSSFFPPLLHAYRLSFVSVVNQSNNLSADQIRVSTTVSGTREESLEKKKKRKRTHHCRAAVGLAALSCISFYMPRFSSSFAVNQSNNLSANSDVNNTICASCATRQKCLEKRQDKRTHHYRGAGLVAICCSSFQTTAHWFA